MNLWEEVKEGGGRAACGLGARGAAGAQACPGPPAPPGGRVAPVCCAWWWRRGLQRPPAAAGQSPRRPAVRPAGGGCSPDVVGRRHQAVPLEHLTQRRQLILLAVGRVAIGVVVILVRLTAQGFRARHGGAVGADGARRSVRRPGACVWPRGSRAPELQPGYRPGGRAGSRGVGKGACSACRAARSAGAMAGRPGGRTSPRVRARRGPVPPPLTNFIGVQLDRVALRVFVVRGASQAARGG